MSRTCFFHGHFGMESVPDPLLLTDYRVIETHNFMREGNCKAKTCVLIDLNIPDILDLLLLYNQST